MTTTKTEEEIRSEWKAHMLRKLDDVRRRVETGEIRGVMCFAEREDGSVLGTRAGSPAGAAAIVVLREYVRKAECEFFDLHAKVDDGKPDLKAVRGPRLGLRKRSEHGTRHIQGPEAVSGLREDGDREVPVLRAPASPEEAEALAEEAEALRDEYETIAEYDTHDAAARRKEIRERQREIMCSVLELIQQSKEA